MKRHAGSLDNASQRIVDPVHFNKTPFAEKCIPQQEHKGRRFLKLEAIRGFAAAYVVLHHAHLANWLSVKILLGFGQEAVILFFLLSGFVIYYATLRGTDDLRFGRYFSHRFRRIWPTFLISLALAYAASCAGAWWSGGWGRLLGNLAMLQDVSALKKGVWVDTYAGNTPLWSLSYEWWFYMMFFPIVSVLFYSPKRQIGLVFVLSVLGFLSYQAIPNQLSLFLGYFFIWWVGVELSREYSSTGAITWSRQRMPVMMLVCLCALWSMPVAIAGSSAGKLLFGVGPVLQMRHFAAALIFTVVGIAWYHAEFVGFRLLLNPFAVLAPISYALYAFHVPVLQILESAGIKSPLPRLTIALIILLPICYLVEVVLQRRINRCFDRIIARSVLRSE